LNSRGKKRHSCGFVFVCGDERERERESNDDGRSHDYKGQQ